MAKHLKSNMRGDFVSIEDPRKKSPPKDINNDWIKPYWLARDRVLYKICDEETKQEILKRYGKA